jgi:hypothetical protein
MKLGVVAFAAAIAAATAVLPVRSNAGADRAATAVLEQEQRWLDDAAHDDARALGTILADRFVHIDYRGRVQDREALLRAISRPHLYTEHLSEQTVDVAGDAAVVHGLNTIVERGRVVLLLRYTDVFVRQSGSWKAISAQETPVGGR